MLTPALRKLFAITAYALSAAVAFDGLALLLALAVGTVAFALIAQPGPAGETSRYRLEHRSPGWVRVLAATGDEVTGRETLQRQTAQLTAAGALGQLVLVDVASERAISWQVLGPRTTDGTAG